jgi:hypothetical protein
MKRPEYTPEQIDYMRREKQIAQDKARREMMRQEEENVRVRREVTGLDDDALAKLKAEVLAELVPEIRHLFDKDPRKSLPLMLLIDKRLRRLSTWRPRRRRTDHHER